jgi:hypothetical protein
MGFDFLFFFEPEDSASLDSNMDLFIQFFCNGGIGSISVARYTLSLLQRLIEVGKEDSSTHISNYKARDLDATMKTLSKHLEKSRIVEITFPQVFYDCCVVIWISLDEK